MWHILALGGGYVLLGLAVSLIICRKIVIMRGDGE